MKKSIQVLLIILVAIALFIPFLLNPRNSPVFLPFEIWQPTGFLTISLSQQQFTTSDPNNFLNGKLWIFSIVQNQLAQKATGTFQGTDKLKKFTIELIQTRQSCQYPILVDYTKSGPYNLKDSKLYIYGLARYSMLLSNDQIKQDCSKYGEVIFYGFKPSYSFEKGCLYRNPISSYAGKLKTVANISFETRMALTIEGQQPIIQTISNQGATTAKFDDIAYAIWTQGGIKGASCPDPVSSGVMAIYYNGSWRLVDSTKYNDYKNAELTLLTVDPNTYSYDSLINLYERINKMADAVVLSQKSFGSGSLKNQTYLSNGYYELPVSGMVMIPNFTLYVKADAIEIYTPYSVPQIISVQGTSMKTGETGYLTVTYKNTGDKGGFTISTNCGTYTIERVVEKGATDTVKIPVTCSFVGTKQCTITVKGTEKSESRTVDLACMRQYACTPKTRICESNRYLKECNADGTAYVTIADCSQYDKECGYDQYNVLNCIAKPQPIIPLPIPQPTQTPTPNQQAPIVPIQPQTQTNSMLIIVVAGIILLLILALVMIKKKGVF